MLSGRLSSAAAVSFVGRGQTSVAGSARRFRFLEEVVAALLIVGQYGIETLLEAVAYVGWAAIVVPVRSCGI